MINLKSTESGVWRGECTAVHEAVDAMVRAICDGDSAAFVDACRRAILQHIVYLQSRLRKHEPVGESLYTADDVLGLADAVTYRGRSLDCTEMESWKSRVIEAVGKRAG